MEASSQQGKASKTGQAQIGEGKSIQVSRTTEAANDVLINAMGLVGTPYRWGGDNEREGFDCSGLIRHVFAETLDMNLPRRSAEMSVMQGKVVAKDKLKTGDLLFFSTAGKRSGVNHAGIYVGNGRFVHAPRKGRNVSVSSLDAAYWQKTFTVAKRVITPKALDLAKADIQH
jgi:cell wall-associated NlpC family hydrolase